MPNEAPRLFASIFILLLAALGLSSPAGAEIAKEAKVGGGVVTLKLIKGENDIVLEVYEKGKLIQKFESLGVQLFPIEAAGKKIAIITKDLDKDGDEEVLFRTTQPPITGSLWVMRWDRKKQVFFHAHNDHGDRYLPVPQGTVVRLKDNGDVQFQTAVSKSVLTFRWSGSFYVER